MRRTMREDGLYIIDRAIKAVLPDAAVKRALEDRKFTGRVVLVAVGKAAWQMAKVAYDCMGDRIYSGVVITKYGHVKGSISNFTCCEAGHPIPDENSFRATQAALDMVRGLSNEDTVIFLLSGGGSALFEKPLVSAAQLQEITMQMLASGADIVEMNTVRKRLSQVKGGRFAQACAPAHVFAIVLSDILGDPLDMIASGPVSPDISTCDQAKDIVRKYGLRLSDEAYQLLGIETPKTLDNVEACITGSVRQLCEAGARACQELGYEPVILTDQMCCQAKEAGSFLASIARSHTDTRKPLAFLVGGETVVHLTGKGKGGRNQELVLSAANGIRGLEDTLVLSFGSDGTDGPTDAAGGIVDGTTADKLTERGLRIHELLKENDAYHALEQVDSLIFTGPTGTNVNDLAVLLIAVRHHDGNQA